MASVVLNEGWFPGWARKVLDDYITESHDPIVRIAELFIWNFVDR